MAGATKYKNEWQKEHKDRLNLVLPKGEKQKIQDAADKVGQSISRYIWQAVSMRMEVEKSIGENGRKNRKT